MACSRNKQAIPYARCVTVSIFVAKTFTIMAIRVKAVERKLKFSNNPEDQGEYRYILSAEIYKIL